MQIVLGWGTKDAKGWFRSVKKPAEGNTLQAIGAVRVNTDFPRVFPKIN